MSFVRDNYFSFLSFLPIAFSKIPLSVAPDFVAPSPNLAIKDFSSSI